MTALRITAKGRLTLRRAPLQHLGIAPGRQLEVHKLANGVLASRATLLQGPESFAGCLPPPGTPTLGLEAMSAVIAQGRAGKP